MRIILAQNKDEVVKTVVEALLDRITSKPRAVIGLATGKTMEPIYRRLVSESQRRNIAWDQVQFFLLDEYLGISKDHPGSFYTYIKNNLMGPLGLSSSQFHMPPTHLIGLEQNPGLSYESSIQQCGGIDFQLLGVGTNGHIGFNEPGSSCDSRTRVVKLTQETRSINEKSFGGEVPELALSMGIATIKDAKELCLVATGESKAKVIKHLFNHHDDKNCPVTYLKDHPRFVLVLDPEAASKVSLNI